MVNKSQNFRVLNYAASFFLLCLVILTAQSQAQVTVDSRSARGAFSITGVATLSWTHTVGSGADRAIFVGISTTPLLGIGMSLPGSTAPVVSVTYNGVSMTQVTGIGGIDRQVSIYRLVNPPTGTGTVTVSFIPGTVTHALGNSVSFFGVNQTTPTSNSSTNASTFGFPSKTPTIVVSGIGVTANDVVFDALASTPQAGFFLEGKFQTVCTNPADETTCTRGRRFFFDFSYDIGASSTEQANPAFTFIVMSWTMTNVQPWVIAATVVKATVPTAASVSIGGRVLTSTGRGVAKARVTLTSQNGEKLTALTNPFGYYRFDNVPVGQTIILEVFSKHFQFASQVITANEDIAELNFISQP